MAKFVIKLSNPELQKPLKLSNFCVLWEMLMSPSSLDKFKCFGEKMIKSMFSKKYVRMFEAD